MASLSYFCIANANVNVNATFYTGNLCLSRMRWKSHVRFSEGESLRGPTYLNCLIRWSTKNLTTICIFIQMLHGCFQLMLWN